jgi:hypothetical protein
MRIDSSGNVGIGTSSPSSYTSGDQLVIASASGNGQMTLAGADVGNPTIFFRRVSAPSTTRGYIQYDNTSDWLRFATNGSERMRIDSSGNVGIGVTPFTNSLSKSLDFGGGAGLFGYANNAYISANLYYDGAWKYKATGYGTSLEMTGADGIMKFNRVASGSAGASATLLESMRIDASGNLLVGGTSTNESFSGIPSIQGSTNCIFTNKRSITSSASQFRFYNPNGQVGDISTSGSATTYGTSSDYRLKENVAPMTGALSTVAQLKPCTYTWKIDGSSGQGFIAHELQAVVPDCVTGEKDAVNEDGSIKPQGIDTSFLVATLTAAIQEQQALIVSMREELDALKTKVGA